MDGHKLIIEFKIKMTPCLISLKASDQYGLTNVTNRLEMRKIFFNSSYEPSGTYNIVSNQFNCQVHLYSVKMCSVAWVRKKTSIL